MTDTPTDLTKPVRTRSGLDVRILCTDAPGDYPVEGEYLQDDDWVMGTWTTEGRYWLSGVSEFDNLDLINVPETTKRYTSVWPGVGLPTKEAERISGGGYPIIELTYEGDKLTAVKIVED